MKVRILDEAEQDLIDGFQFYEQREPGLGDYFLNSLFSDIDSLRLYGGIHSGHLGYYRLLSVRFPFAIYYKTEAETVVVWAVVDWRQEPARIEGRLTVPRKT